MYMNTGRPRPWLEPKPASEARLQAMSKHLMVHRHLMEPHECFQMLEIAKKRLVPKDKLKLQTYINSWTES